MVTIDLTSPAPAPQDTLDGLPRRLSLTLAELQLLAKRAGGAPLPFDVAAPVQASGLASRLGQTRLGAEDAAFQQASASSPDAEQSLRRRGLVSGSVNASVAGALGVLAAPDLAVDIDVSVAGDRARAWHRRSGDAVVSLATADGLVHELAWFGVDQWADELGRVLTLPTDHGTRPSGVPEQATLPFELLDAGSEAARSGRSDLLTAITARHLPGTRDADGAPLDSATASALVSALVTETQGRARLMVARASAPVTRVGVVSLVLLADGWRILAARRDGDQHLVDIRALQPSCLASQLAPVIAEVQA
ncbi:hypothetical protein [Nocardioides alcanivorans]|uniref:hypothetical protein n=1 Tax=Nocardioides alcanivorans TaxID=2897352 RepID=UPI001F23F7C1|nr:hypothetical protein [Nocardioides alcanivorans]